jgi:hypothetical protein
MNWAEKTVGTPAVLGRTLIEMYAFNACLELGRLLRNCAIWSVVSQLQHENNTLAAVCVNYLYYVALAMHYIQTRVKLGYLSRVLRG